MMLIVSERRYERLHVLPELLARLSMTKVSCLHALHGGAVCTHAQQEHIPFFGIGAGDVLSDRVCSLLCVPCGSCSIE